MNPTGYEYPFVFGPFGTGSWKSRFVLEDVPKEKGIDTMKDPQTEEPVEDEPEVPASEYASEKAPRKLTSNKGPIANTPETRGPVHPLDKPEKDFNQPDDIGVDVI